MAKKNEEIVRLAEECAKLKKNLLQSSYEYNETIAGLKEQVALLKVVNSERVIEDGTSIS